MSRIVITGAPGAGKTTLLLALQARGYTIVGDTARIIIQDRPVTTRNWNTMIAIARVLGNGAT